MLFEFEMLLSKKAYWLIIPYSAEFVSVSVYFLDLFFSVTLLETSPNFRCSQVKV